MLGGGFTAQDTRGTVEAPSTTEKVFDSSTIPHESYTLENGLTIILHEDPSVKI